MIPKAFRALLGGAAALLAAACDNAGYQVVVDYSMGDSFTFLRGAAAKGPVWVDLRGNPFADAGAGLDAVVAEAFRRGVTQLGGVSFTTDRDLAGDPQYRIVLVFGGAQPGRSIDRVCQGDIPTRGGGIGPDGEVRTLAVFCADSQSRVAVSGVARGVDGPDSRNLRKLLTLSLQKMF